MVVHFNPSYGETETKRFLGLIGQPSQTSKCQTNEVPCLKKQGKEHPKEQHPKLSSILHMSAYIHACACLHTCVPKHTRTHMHRHMGEDGGRETDIDRESVLVNWSFCLRLALFCRPRGVSRSPCTILAGLVNVTSKFPFLLWVYLDTWANHKAKQYALHLWWVSDSGHSYPDLPKDDHVHVSHHSPTLSNQTESRNSVEELSCCVGWPLL